MRDASNTVTALDRGPHGPAGGKVSSQRAQRVPRWTETCTDCGLKHCQHVLAASLGVLIPIRLYGHFPSKEYITA